MTILALEFSSSQRSVAVLHENGVAEAIESGGRGTNAFNLIERVLTEAGLVRGQIDVVAVGLGPGSYTGIRVALSIAQGWQLARGVKLLGISSAECLAAQAQTEKMLGIVKVLIDAQRNEFYCASYDLSPDDRREIERLHISDVAGALTNAAASEIWIGPEVTRWFPKGRIMFPSAATMARLARERRDFQSGEKLTPIYLREAAFIIAPPPIPLPLEQ